jgi:hypothetical protein
VALISYAFPEMHVFYQGLIWALLGLGVWLSLSRWNKARHKARPDINDFDPVDSLPASDRARRDAQRNRPEE